MNNKNQPIRVVPSGPPAPSAGWRSRVRGLSKRTKLLITFAGVLLVAVVLLALWPRSASAPPAKTSDTKKTNSSEAKKVPGKIRLIASGDTIAHDALNLRAKQADGSYDFYSFMKPMQPFFDAADVRFCNQAVPGGGTAFGIKGYPVFNSPLEVVHDLNKLGCNVVNTGTNHTFDRGQAVIDAQLNEWDKQPNMLAVAGANRSDAEQQNIRYFTVQGVKFAFLSYSTYTNISPPNTFGLNMFNEASAKQQVSAARTQADVVLVSMRWGTEYSPVINGQQERQAQLLADWGADVVLGHGPHVVQPVKQLQGAGGRSTVVWYSIGNFLNAQIQTEALVSGLAVMDFDVATKKTVSPPSYLPIYMHYEWTAEEKAREDLLQRNNFTLLPLDQAEALMARSQNKTTVEAQTTRLQALLNQFTKVELVTSKSYLQKTTD